MASLNLKHRYTASVITHFLAKGSTFIQTLVLMPLLVDKHGLSEYGLLMLLQSILLWVMIDTGLTESIKKYVIDSINEWRRDSFKLTLSKLNTIFYIFQTVLFIILALLFVLVNRYFFEVDYAYTGYAVLLIGYVTSLQKVARDVLVGFNQAHVFYAVRACSLVLTLPISIWLVNYTASELWVSLFALNLFGLVASLILTVNHIYKTRLIFPGFNANVSNELGWLKSRSANFFLVGLCVILIQDSDLIIFKFLFSPEELGLYAIYHKYFQYTIVISSILLVPMWSYIVSKNNGAVPNDKVIQLLSGGVIFAMLVSMAVLLPSGYAIEYLSGGIVSKSISLIIIFLIYFFLRCYAAVITLLLKIKGSLNLLSIVSVVEAVFHVTLPILYSYVFDGITIYEVLIVWAVAVLLVRVLWPIYGLTRRTHG